MTLCNSKYPRFSFKTSFVEWTVVCYRAQNHGIEPYKTALQCAGHPEGYLEAFANLYVTFAEQIRAHQAGQPLPEHTLDLPNIEDGIRGMKFIETVVKSSQEKAWLPL